MTAYTPGEKVLVRQHAYRQSRLVKRTVSRVGRKYVYLRKEHAGHLEDAFVLETGRDRYGRDYITTDEHEAETHRAQVARDRLRELGIGRVEYGRRWDSLSGDQLERIIAIVVEPVP